MYKNILQKLISKKTMCCSCHKNFSLFKWEYSCVKCKNLFCDDCLYNENGFKLCKSCHNDFLVSNNNWIAGTKQEYIKDYVIVKEIGLIEIRTPCSSPADVEKLLKTKSAIFGANAYVKFFWDKQVENHAEDDLRFGKNGKSYYKTKYYKTQYYIGNAVAVIVQKK